MMSAFAAAAGGTGPTNAATSAAEADLQTAAAVVPLADRLLVTSLVLKTKASLLGAILQTGASPRSLRLPLRLLLENAPESFWTLWRAIPAPSAKREPPAAMIRNSSVALFVGVTDQCQHIL